jgi:hypothetical protein
VQTTRTHTEDAHSSNRKSGKADRKSKRIARSYATIWTSWHGIKSGFKRTCERELAGSRSPEIEPRSATI